MQAGRLQKRQLLCRLLVVGLAFWQLMGLMSPQH